MELLPADSSSSRAEGTPLEVVQSAVPDFPMLEYPERATESDSVLLFQSPQVDE